MTRKLKDLAVIVSTYQDQYSGQKKNRYKNVGSLMEGERNGEKYQYLMLDKTFNPAGVPTKDGSDAIFISMFEPQDKNKGKNSEVGF